MNQAIWGINTAIKSIQSMAKLLKLGATNVRMIAGSAEDSNTDRLSGANKKIYTAAINVLVNNLKSSNKAAADIRDKLDAYSKTLIGIQSTMQAVSARLVSTAKGKSKEFTDWRDATRAKVYGGCAASVLGGPVAVAACYSIGAGVLETEIKTYQNKVNQFTADFTGWAKTFDNLSLVANKAASVSKDWYSKIVDYKVVIQSTLDLIVGGTQPVLFLKRSLRKILDKNLEMLIKASD